MIEDKKAKIDEQIKELQNSVESIVTKMDNYQLQWMGSINKILACDVHDNENINELKAIAKDYYKRIEEFNTNIDLENLDLDYFVEIQRTNKTKQ